MEKQKLKEYYGILEKQMTVMWKKQPALGKYRDLLVQALECRLDNLVYRLGFAILRQARQMVVHGHILLNGKADRPSMEFLGINRKGKIPKGGLISGFLPLAYIECSLPGKG